MFTFSEDCSGRLKKAPVSLSSVCLSVVLHLPSGVALGVDGAL